MGAPHVERSRGFLQERDSWRATVASAVCQTPSRGQSTHPAPSWGPHRSREGPAWRGGGAVQQTQNGEAGTGLTVQREGRELGLDRVSKGLRGA